MNIVLSHFGDLLDGFVVTLELTALAFVGALILGTLLAVCRVGPITALRVVGSIYVEFFRNIPLLSLLILFVFGLPDIGISYSLFTSTAVCLALAAAAFVCKAMRAGINTVSVGQAEAARALGLPFTKCLRFVILPPGVSGHDLAADQCVIGVELSSSLAAAVGVAELTNRTEQLNLHYAQAVAGFLVAGALYIGLALAAGGTGGWLERRVTVRR